ncbi:MAG: hypothetical protein HOV79_21200 [Hamadaea sp.]|nr:hypothetical protein [Hamadaea sp.]
MAAVAGVCVAVLVGTGDGRDVAVGFGLALLLWLRSRLFDRAAHALPLRLVAGGALLTAVVRVLLTGQPWALPAALAALVAVTIAAGVRRRGVPGRRRWLRVAELGVAAATTVAVAAATGLADLADLLRGTG